MGNLEYALIAFVIVVAISIALETFLANICYIVMTTMNNLMKARNERAGF